MYLYRMKVSNETRVGALAAIAITVLILGFNFLKGRNLMARKDTIYAVFSRTDGLSTSDAIRINGLQVEMSPPWTSRTKTSPVSSWAST